MPEDFCICFTSCQIATTNAPAPTIAPTIEPISAPTLSTSWESIGVSKGLDEVVDGVEEDGLVCVAGTVKLVVEDEDVVETDAGV